MKNIDFLSLDGRSLRTFLIVLEEKSISKAAARLGVTQSAVSHLLDKLRLTLGDPLFVRAGRGIAPTERAISLREPIQTVLDGLKSLTDERVFDASLGQLDYVIGANDFQRDLIFPGLLKRLQCQGIDALFRFIPAGIPASHLLRQARCQLLVTPFPPEGPDIYQLRLFDDSICCFYDSDCRSAPSSLDDFIASEYIEVRFEDDESAMKIIQSDAHFELKPPRISVPNFSALPAFLRGSQLISIVPSLMGEVTLNGFESAPLPFDTSPMTMYMAWHRRDHHDPAHQWLRNSIKDFVEDLGVKQTDNS